MHDQIYAGRPHPAEHILTDYRRQCTDALTSGGLQVFGLDLLLENFDQNPSLTGLITWSFMPAASDLSRFPFMTITLRFELEPPTLARHPAQYTSSLAL